MFEDVEAGEAITSLLEKHSELTARSIADMTGMETSRVNSWLYKQAAAKRVRRRLLHNTSRPYWSLNRVEAIRQALRYHGPMTARELARVTGLRKTDVNSWLYRHLRQGGLVRNEFFDQAAPIWELPDEDEFASES